MRMTGIAAGLAAALLYAGAAVAGTIETTVNAVAFKPIDGTTAVQVRLYDDSPRDRAIRDALLAALADAGHAVQADAPLVLTFDMRSTVGEGGDPAEAGRFEFRADGSSAREEQYSARYKLFSSRDVAEVDPEAAYGGRVRLEMALTDRGNGRRVWQGWALADATGRENTNVARALVVPLVDALGQTVRDRAVETPME